MIPGQAQQFFEAAAAQAGGFQIERSLRFNSGDSAYLDRTPSSASNRRTWTWSGWVKRSGLGAYDFLFMAQTSSVLKSSLSFWNGDYIRFKGDYNDGTARNFSVSTNALFRDPSAWYHVVCRLDTTQTTAADRIKIWVNGVEQTFSSATYPTQNSDIEFNNTSEHLIGSQTSAPQNGLDGYLAEVHFVDGQALAATDFGEYDDNNVWQPIEFTGNYSTSGVSFDFLEQQLYAGGTREALFDGSTSTGCNFQKTSASSSGTAPSNTKRIKVTFPTAKTGVTKLRIYGGGNLSSTNKVWYNDDVSTMITNDDPVGWKTVYTGTAITINSISFGTSDGGSNLRAIEINDVILTDTVEQGVNSFHLDFSDNSTVAALGTDSSGNNNDWTVNNISGPGGDVDYASMMTQQSNGGYYANNGPEKAFDGLLTTSPNTQASNNNGNITFTPSPSISFTTSVRAYWQHGNTGATYSYNGGSATSITASGWITLASGSGTFTSLNAYRGGDGQYFSAIEVDGTILLTSTGADNDSLIDTPTNYTADSGNNGGNYATLNPLNKTVATLSDGNLFYEPHGSTQHCVSSTMAVASGKWYWEYTIETTGTYHYAGIADVATDYTENWCGSNSGWTVSVNTGGNISYNGAENLGFIGTSPASGQTWGWALDMDAGTLKVYINGSIQYSGNSIIPTSTSLAGRTITPAAGHFAHKNLTFNFGQRPFAYTPPTDHLSLCSQNLSDPAIADGSTAMDVALYTGNDTARSITGLNIAPDVVWIKKRSGTGNHSLADTVRGATKNLVPNDTNSESTEPSYVTAFNSDGFSLGTSSIINNNGDTYVSWNWDAGTSTESNTDGSITSSVRANQTAGLSIVTWTRSGGSNTATIGHGLNAVPELIILKDRDTSTNWYVGSPYIDPSRGDFLSCLNLNLSTARFNNSDVFTQGGAPSSSVFGVGAVGNPSGDNLAYCFAPVEGYSAFGSYTGNANADGPFVFTGFRPKWVLIRCSSVVQNWVIIDAERNTYNIVNNGLYADLTNAEQTSNRADFTSNGFKIRTNSGELNTNSGTHLYAAFAEHPFKTARAR